MTELRVPLLFSSTSTCLPLPTTRKVFDFNEVPLLARIYYRFLRPLVQQLWYGKGSLLLHPAKYSTLLCLLLLLSLLSLLLLLLRFSAWRLLKVSVDIYVCAGLRWGTSFFTIASSSTLNHKFELSALELFFVRCPARNTFYKKKSRGRVVASRILLHFSWT